MSANVNNILQTYTLFKNFNTKLYKNGGKYKKSNKMDQKIKEKA